MKEMPRSTEMYKVEYCRGDKMRCARYMVYSALGRPAVPSALYPFQVIKAKSIIAGGGETH
jgi:hypothetical protein